MYDLKYTYEPGTFNQEYKTILNEENTILLDKDDLPSIISDTFKNGQYKTVKNTKPIVLYRVWGKVKKENTLISNADYYGSFATTEFAESKIDVKLRLSLNPKWRNPRLYECKILVPTGTKLNFGIVASIKLENGTVFCGGADQVLLPQDWSNAWIIGCRKVTPQQIHQVPEYPLDFFSIAKFSF